MYKNRLFTLLLLLIMASKMAQAGDHHHVVIDGGIVHLRGSLMAEACTVSTESRNQTVDMGQLRSNLFTGVGSLTSPVGFSIRLTECSIAVSDQAGVTFLGVTDVKDPQVFKAGQGENAATGVGLALFNQNGELLVPNVEPRIWRQLHEGENTLRFLARYRATSQQVTGGNADVFTWFALTYQ